MTKRDWYQAIHDEAKCLLKLLWERKSDREITRLIEGLRDKDILVALSLLVHRLDGMLNSEIPFD